MFQRSSIRVAYVLASCAGLAACTTEDETYTSQPPAYSRTQTYTTDYHRNDALSHRQDSSSWRQQPGTLFFPTGRPDSSSIAMTVQAPNQVRVGQPYAFDVQVTNIT